MLIRGRQTTTSSNRVQSQGARAGSIAMERVVEGATGGMAGSAQGGTALKLRSLWFNAEHRLERF